MDKTVSQNKAECLWFHNRPVIIRIQNNGFCQCTGIKGDIAVTFKQSRFNAAYLSDLIRGKPGSIVTHDFITGVVVIGKGSDFTEDTIR